MTIRFATHRIVSLPGFLRILLPLSMYWTLQYEVHLRWEDEEEEEEEEEEGDEEATSSNL